MVPLAPCVERGQERLMRASVEEFLYFLMWTADPLLRPRWRGFEESFETWVFRRGLGRRIQHLAARKLIESKTAAPAPGEGLWRLTDAGRLQALGGRDPQQLWDRAWDGKWRLLMFDLPARDVALRTRLRRYLRAQSFGYLQNSVWLTPDSLADARRVLDRHTESVGTIVLFEGNACLGTSDEELVNGGWDFAEINRRYERHLKILEQCPCKTPPRTDVARNRVLLWARRELAAWKAAFIIDPLLPRTLHPAGYRGADSWQARWATFASLSAL